MPGGGEIVFGDMEGGKVNPDSLVDRIKTGMTTEHDARLVAEMIEKIAAYENALREIALYGKGDMALKALKVLMRGG